MRSIRLGEILDVQSGFAFKTEFFSEAEGIPLIRIRDLPNSSTETNYTGEYRDDCFVDTGDYLIGMDGHFRCHRWQGPRALLNQRVCRLRNFEPNVAPEYIYYAIQKNLQDLEANTSFATVKHISGRQIQNIGLSLPPLSEQRRIVDILSRAEGIVRLQKQAAEKTREIIPALFLDMFGDPATNPKGWEVSSLGDLITQGSQNGLYKHASAYGDGVPIVRIDAFYDGIITEMTTLRRLRLTNDEICHYGLRETDIVINRVNSPEYLGKSALVPKSVEATVFESNMMRFAVDHGRVLPGYVILYLQTSLVKRSVLSKAKHAINQSSINQQDVKALSIPVPHLMDQQAFVSRVESIRSIESQAARALERAEATFQSLLHGAFAGQL